MRSKRKILIVFLMILTTFVMVSCEDSQPDGSDYSPDIQGLPEDGTLELRVGDVYDPYDGIVAFDPVDGNITDSIFITGVDQLPLDSSNEVTESGTYMITYNVINNAGVRTSEDLSIVITSFWDELADYDIGEYELVFSDEFDYEGLPDSNKWNLETGGWGFGNNEIQYYTDREENAYVSDGALTIRLLKEDYDNRNYTSAKLTTEDKDFWEYAKIEIRAILPSGLGTWPAFWMMPQYDVYGGWPSSGELDIMEHVGYDPDMVHGTIHTKLYNGMAGTHRGGSIHVENARTEYHVYSVEWLPDKIVWYVDGQEYFEYKFQVDSFSQLEEDEYWQIWPYNQEFYLIMNIAFGGTWGGSQGIDTDLTEAEMIIDYVRVYQGTGLMQSDEE